MKKYIKKAVVLSLIAIFLFTFSVEATEDIRERLEDMEKILDAIVLNLGAGGVEGIPSGFQFTENISQGTRGENVKYLQILLNINSQTRVAQTGPGSTGNETEYFGSATHSAVIKFQNKYARETLHPLNLTTGTGFVGQSTRIKLNQLLQTGDTGQDSDIMKIVNEVRERLEDLFRRLEYLEKGEEEKKEEDDKKEIIDKKETDQEKDDKKTGVITIFSFGDQKPTLKPIIHGKGLKVSNLALPEYAYFVPKGEGSGFYVKYHIRNENEDYFGFKIDSSKNLEKINLGEIIIQLKAENILLNPQGSKSLYSDSWIRIDIETSRDGKSFKKADSVDYEFDFNNEDWQEIKLIFPPDHSNIKLDSPLFIKINVTQKESRGLPVKIDEIKLYGK